MPELRVGTLDSLLALSDDLVRVNALVEAVASKIRRQVVDLAAIEGATEELSVDGISAERYLTAFTWDEAKHPARRPLRETVEKLQESVAKVDDEFNRLVDEERTFSITVVHTVCPSRFITQPPNQLAIRINISIRIDPITSRRLSHLSVHSTPIRLNKAEVAVIAQLMRQHSPAVQTFIESTTRFDSSCSAATTSCPVSQCKTDFLPPAGRCG